MGEPSSCRPKSRSRAIGPARSTKLKLEPEPITKMSHAKLESGGVPVSWGS